tara:strand:+ start:7730 stop:9238 length:1509 start_codon:yes stop_codon:yes gene_type:complete
LAADPNSHEYGYGEECAETLKQDTAAVYEILDHAVSQISIDAYQNIFYFPIVSFNDEAGYEAQYSDMIKYVVQREIAHKPLHDLRDAKHIFLYDPAQPERVITNYIQPDMITFVTALTADVALRSSVAIGVDTLTVVGGGTVDEASIDIRSFRSYLCSEDFRFTRSFLTSSERFKNIFRAHDLSVCKILAGNFDTISYFDPGSDFLSRAVSAFNATLNSNYIEIELQKIREQLVIANESLNEINQFTQTKYYEDKIAQLNAQIAEAEKDSKFADIIKVVSVGTAVVGIAGSFVGVGDAVGSTGALLRSLEGSFSDRASELWKDKAKRKSLEDFAKKIGENGAKASSEYNRLTDALKSGGASADELRRRLDVVQRQFDDALADFALRKVAVENAMSSLASESVTNDDKRYRILSEFSSIFDIFVGKVMIGIGNEGPPDLAARCSTDLRNMMESVTPFNVQTLLGACSYALDLSKKNYAECDKGSISKLTLAPGVQVPICGAKL